MGLEKINEMRKSKGMSIDDLCEKSGIPKGTLSKITAGITKNPSVDTVKAIVYAMGYTLDDLDNFPNIKTTFNFSADEIDHIKFYRSLDAHGKDMVDTVLKKESERMHNLIALDKPSNLINLKYSPCKASAGTGSFLFDDCTDEDITVLYNEYTRLADICICVSGDSMEPKFSDGDILLVRNQPSIEEGQYGIFVKGNEGYVKKKGSDRLISLNPEYEDIYPESEGIYCYGKVIGKLDSNWIIEK